MLTHQSADAESLCRTRPLDIKSGISTASHGPNCSTQHHTKYQLPINNITFINLLYVLQQLLLYHHQ